MKRTFIIFSLFLALLATRLFFINGDNNITPYITLINSISFIIVIISIIEDTFSKIRNEINEKDVAPQIKLNETKDASNKKNILYTVNLIMLIGILLSSAEYNDALSIITIAISLLNEEIGIIVSKIIKKWSNI